MFCISESRHEDFYQDLVARLDRVRIKGDKAKLKTHLQVMAVFERYKEIVRKFNPYHMSSVFDLNKDGDIYVSIEMHKFFECTKGSKLVLVILPPMLPYIRE